MTGTIRNACVALACAWLLTAAPLLEAQPDLQEQTTPVPILDGDHFGLVGALHSPTPITGFDKVLGHLVYLFFHGGLFANPGFHDMNPAHATCADGDNISVALFDQDDIGTPANLLGYLYNQFPRMGRVSPCSTDTHAQQADSTGTKLGAVGGSWTHGPPFTDGGFLTDFNGKAGKFMIMSRGDNSSGHLPDTWIFRSTTWNSRKGQWNAGIFPMVTIHSSVINQVQHISPVVLPPTPTDTSIVSGHRVVTWHGYFRWNGFNTGRIIVEFSPGLWGTTTPVQVKIEKPNGVFQALGPSGVLNFVPRKVHREHLTGTPGNPGLPGTPLQIYEDGAQRYLITRQKISHNSNYPTVPPGFPACVPGSSNYNNTYLPQRGGHAAQILVFPLTGPHQEGAPGTLISSHRTGTGVVPTDYSVSLFGSGLVKVNGTLYFLSSDRLDSICTRTLCAASGTPNPFCGLDISASEVILY